MKKLFLWVIFLCAVLGIATATPIIEADVTDGDAPLTVQFSCITTHTNISTINWFFGDGAVSHEQNPVHTFTNPGMYSVKLEVLYEYVPGKLGGDINTKTAFIKVGEGYSGKHLTTAQLYEHANKTKKEWENMTWIESSSSPVSAMQSTATPTPTETKVVAEKTLLKTAVVDEITATPTPTPEPTATYNAQAEIEALKKQNEELQKQVDEQGDFLDKIWKLLSGMLGVPQ